MHYKSRLIRQLFNSFVSMAEVFLGLGIMIIGKENVEKIRDYDI
jgi:hypothetical protein